MCLPHNPTNFKCKQVGSADRLIWKWELSAGEIFRYTWHCQSLQVLSSWIRSVFLDRFQWCPNWVRDLTPVISFLLQPILLAAFNSLSMPFFFFLFNKTFKDLTTQSWNAMLLEWNMVVNITSSTIKACFQGKYE